LWLELCPGSCWGSLQRSSPLAGFGRGKWGTGMQRARDRKGTEGGGREGKGKEKGGEVNGI